MNVGIGGCLSHYQLKIFGAPTPEQSARAGPLLKLFGTDPPCEGSFLFGNDCQAIEVARGRFWPFFQMRLEIVE